MLSELFSFSSNLLFPQATPPPLPHFEALIKPISLIIGLTPDLLLANFPGGGGGYSLTRGYWGCAPGWGRIFTTGGTIMGSCFQ